MAIEALLLATGITSLISLALVIVGIVVIIYLIFKFGQSLIRIVIGIIANSILGLVALLALNYFFNFGISYSLGVLVATAVFGLPAVGTMVVLKTIGGVALSLL